jgi:muramoyltetrapeptide carboxypeptidase
VADTVSGYWRGPKRAVGVLTAGAVPRANAEAGAAVLAELGVDVALPDNLFESDGDPRSWLAGADATRAERLAAAMAAGVDLVWLVRGGFGSARLLGDVAGRWRGAAGGRAPTLVAFSDGTALLAAWHRAQWPAWSGPPLTQLTRLDELSLARLRAWLKAGHLAPFNELVPMAQGQVRGPCFAANLCVLTSLAGTAHMPDLRGHVLVLEDTGEPPYKIDRMLTQLVQAGALAGVAGVVFGDFTGDRTVPAAALADLDLVFRHFVNDVAIPHGLTVCAGLPVGHGVGNAPLPIGRATAFHAVLTVDAAGGVLAFEHA